jgi:hypothetical protein
MTKTAALLSQQRPSPFPKSRWNYADDTATSVVPWPAVAVSFSRATRSQYSRGLSVILTLPMCSSRRIRPAPSTRGPASSGKSRIRHKLSSHQVSGVMGVYLGFGLTLFWQPDPSHLGQPNCCSPWTSSCARCPRLQSELRKVVETAQKDVLFVDRYMGADFVSSYLPHVRTEVSIRLLTRDLVDKLTASVAAFVLQTPMRIGIHRSKDFHRRFLCIDGSRCFLVDASFKDAAKSAPAALIELTDTAADSPKQYEAIWAAATEVRALYVLGVTSQHRIARSTVEKPARTPAIDGSPSFMPVALAAKSDDGSSTVVVQCEHTPDHRGFQTPVI